MKLKLLNYSYSSLVKHQTMAKMGAETNGGEDQQYTIHASCQSEQGISYCTQNNFTNTHIAVLENFDPNFTPDPFRWIPKGLMEDLIDNTQNETSPVIDNVNGFTIAQLFNALQSDVTSVQIYRARFIQQNLNNQTTNITNLFAQYHY
jgi:hypothetical protein